MQKLNSVLEEARRLHRQGFAILWLKRRSKAPLNMGWTKGPRETWDDLKRTYRPGYNVGVRLGAASRLKDGYLAVIDVDVKSKSEQHRLEAITALRKIFKQSAPIVLSGRGNGSRHYYCVTKEPFKGFDAAWSDEEVKAFIPSRAPSKKDLEKLGPEECAKGYRLAVAWEISLMSEGRQVVLPPSIHPDSGVAYRWVKGIDTGIPRYQVLAPPEKAEADAKKSEIILLDDFKISPVEYAWLPISEAILKGITEGIGVSDRSGFLLKASSALLSAGLSQNEVLTVLTDPQTFIGSCGYDHAQTKSRKRAAEWVYKYTFEKVAREKGVASEIFTIGVAPSRKLTPKEMEEQALEFKEARNWRQDIARTQQGFPAKTLQNIVHIIENAIGEDCIQRDSFAYRDTYSVNTAWGGIKGEAVSDDDIPAIKYWLGTKYQFEPTNNAVSDSLIVLARKNSYDPVKDFLKGLPEWDGKERLNEWLPRNFQAKGDEDYLSQVFRKWMVAMVMRVYRPGAKFDWMPIFEGTQGIGKSSFGKILVGDKYFLDWLPNLNDKDSALSLQGMWAVEMGELSQFKRNELENIKAFLSRTVDKLRPPYGRRLIESPRRCVFFGTTNRTTYLIDETGNRRFKPVMVGSLNFKQLRKDRLQLFAEAKHLWLDKIETERSLDLTGDARIFEQKIHQEKMVQDDSHTMEEAVREFIEKVEKNEVNFDLKKFKTLDLFKGVCPLANWKADRRNSMFAAKMLKRLGAQDRIIRGIRHWKIGQNEDFY